MAELNEKKNERLRAAFGISDSYVDGSSFDPQRRAREAKQPAPEPPKPYRYTRPRNQCQLLVLILSTLLCFIYFGGLSLPKLFRFCFSQVEMSEKICLNPCTSFHLSPALSGSPAVLAHQPQSRKRRKRRKIEDGKLVGKLM